MITQQIQPPPQQPLGYTSDPHSALLAQMLAKLQQSGQNPGTPAALGEDLLAKAMLQNAQASRAGPYAQVGQGPGQGGLLANLTYPFTNMDSGSTAITANDQTGGMGAAVNPATGLPWAQQQPAQPPGGLMGLGMAAQGATGGN